MKWRATSILRLFTPAACSDEEEAWEAFYKTENFNLNLPKRQMAIGCQLCLFSFIVLPHSGKCYIIFCPQVSKLNVVVFHWYPTSTYDSHTITTVALSPSKYIVLMCLARRNTLSLLRLKLNNINLKPTLWFQGQVSLKSLFKIITWQNWASLK